jgi:hypothetical protein
MGNSKDSEVVQSMNKTFKLERHKSVKYNPHTRKRLVYRYQDVENLQ